MVKQEATRELYDIILKPVVTEKAMKGSEQNQVTFLVSMNATKPQIKKAVESIFGAKVKAVNTLCQAGKTKVFRRTEGKRNDYKKAIVTLSEGQSIDITAGV